METVTGHFNMTLILMNLPWSRISALTVKKIHAFGTRENESISYYQILHDNV